MSSVLEKRGADAVRQPVLLFGSGRSGTTWVQDALAEANNYATLFEPMHPDAVPGARAFANLYVRVDESNPDLKRFLSGLFERRYAGLWPELRTRPDRLFPGPGAFLSIRDLKDTFVRYRNTYSRWRRFRHRAGQPRIVKFIRGNLFAHWLKREFGYAAAVVIRHPCAVLASVSKRSGREWTREAMLGVLRRYTAQERLVQDRLSPVLPQLEKLDSMAEIHTAVWCVENAHFLEGNGEHLHVAHFEDLVEKAPEAWESLANALELGVVPDNELLVRPSQQASYNMGSAASSERLLNSWRNTLGDDDLEQVRSVLALFCVDRYTVDDCRPRHHSARSDGA